MPATSKKNAKGTKTGKTAKKKSVTKKTSARKPAAKKKSRQKTVIAAVPDSPIITGLPVIDETESTLESLIQPEIPVIINEPDLEIPDSAPDNRVSGISDKISEINGLQQDETIRNIRVLLDGEFNISRQVLARIASIAASEITGLAPPKHNPLTKFVDQLRGRRDGIRIEVGSTEAAVDMDIRVEYGTRIPEISNRLREVVARRIHEMTGLKVVEVNIRVQDITPPAPTGSAS